MEPSCRVHLPDVCLLCPSFSLGRDHMRWHLERWLCGFEGKQEEKRNSWRGLRSRGPKQHPMGISEGNHCPPNVWAPTSRRALIPQVEAEAPELPDWKRTAGRSERPKREAAGTEEQDRRGFLKTTNQAEMPQEAAAQTYNLGSLSSGSGSIHDTTHHPLQNR